MPSRHSPGLQRAIALVAPGQPLREGLERILRAGMGALIVVGDNAAVLNICSGGFLLDAAFTPQRLSELAKMDGALILAGDSSRIARSNVHLVPDPNVPTSETGTRHRTAERVARSLGVPVLSVSERMSSITVYIDDDKHPLEAIPRVLVRADQALQALERYKERLDDVAGSLSALEVEDLVTLRDVASVLQRSEMVIRIASEIENYILELGVDGRMVRLQLEDLLGGVVDERRLVLADYLIAGGSSGAQDALERLGELDTDGLLDLKVVASSLGLPASSVDLDEAVQPHGYRLLQRVPRLPEAVVEAIIERFGSLHKILRATIEDLNDVEGVGSRRARAIKENLSRITETSIFERYG